MSTSSSQFLNLTDKLDHFGHSSAPTSSLSRRRSSQRSSLAGVTYELQYICQLFLEFSIEIAEILDNFPWRMTISYWKMADYFAIRGNHTHNPTPQRDLGRAVSERLLNTNPLMCDPSWSWSSTELDQYNNGIINLQQCDYAGLPFRGYANCNINAEFWRMFLLKMKKEWRIAPEKRWFCIEKWPFISQFEVPGSDLVIPGGAGAVHR